MKMHFLDDKSLDDLKVRWSPKEFDPWSIEPSGNGVVTVTNSKDTTRTATFFCLSDRTPKISIQLKQHDRIDRKWLEDAIKEVTGVVACDMTFPKEVLKLKYVGDDPVFEYELRGMNEKTISSAKWAGVGVDGPRYIWSAFTFELPKENSEAAISVALKNNL